MQNLSTKFDCTAEPLAIAGVSCRLPGGISSPEALWQALLEQQCLISEVPADRFSLKRFAHPRREVKGHSVTFKAGIAGDLTQFDPGFFKMGRLEAKTLDPQQRLALVLSWEAFESAGVKPSAFKGSNTAVFMGAASTDMAMSRADDASAIGPYSMTGTNLSIISNRLSYFYDLHGQSLTVDTACSSSLTALHLACEALRHGACTAALAGGVNVLLSPLPFVGFSQAHMLSPEGRCKVFAADADGYVRSEGGAVVLLMRLSDALKQGLPIYAVIEDSLINQDGRTNGIALPNQAAQQALLHQIYAGRDLSSLVYLEAHGTGTAAGDPLECAAAGHELGLALKAQQDRPLYIGSVKSNVGHLETASGMAGLIKVLAMLKHQQIPAQLYADNLNPKIDFAGLNLKVSGQTIAFPKVNEPALIGLNSFGFGGSNAHVLLRRFDQDFEKSRLQLQTGAGASQGAVKSAECSSQDAAAAFSIGGELKLLISAESEHALRSLAAAYADQFSTIEDKTEAAALCAAACSGREHLAKRLLLTADSAADLAALLREYAASGKFKAADLTRTEPEPMHQQSAACGVGYARSSAERRWAPFALSAEAAVPGRLALVCSGNGSQYPGMGHDLYVSVPLFKQYFDEAAAALAKLQPVDFAQLILLPADCAELQTLDFDDPKIAQPFIFAIEYALGKVICALGFKPEVCCGHSVGEVAAACLTGELSLAESALVIVRRSYYQAQTSSAGGMAAVKLDKDGLEKCLQEAGGDVCIAAHNAPDSYTLSGLKADLKQTESLIKAQRGAFKLLSLNYAFHSSLMDDVKEDLLASLSALDHSAAHAAALDEKDQADKLQFYSALTAAPCARAELCSSAYWWRNVREQVNFAELISRLMADGFTQFVEIGPRSILVSYIKQLAAAAEHPVSVLGLLPTKAAPGESLQCAKALLQLAAADYTGNLSALFAAGAPECAVKQAAAGLPHYAFDRQRCWPEQSSEGCAYFNPESVDPLLGAKLPFSQGFINQLDTATAPMFSGHQVQGQVLFPFAAYLIAAKRAAELNDEQGRSMSAVNLEVRAPLVLSQGLKRLWVSVGPQRQLSFKGRDFNAAAFSELAVARALPAAVKQRRCDLIALKQRFAAVDPESVYQAAKRCGIDYQGEYRRLQEIYAGPAEVLAKLDCRLEDPALPASVAGLDGALQLLFVLKEKLGAHASDAGAGFAGADLSGLYLPAAAAEFYLELHGRSEMYALLQLKKAQPSALLVDIEFYSTYGELIGELKGCRYRKVPFVGQVEPAVCVQKLELLPSLVKGRSAVGKVLKSLLERQLQLLSEQGRAEDQGAEQTDALTAALLCALTAANLKAVDPLLAQAGISADAAFGCLIDDNALELADYLLDLCCSYGFGEALGDGLFTLKLTELQTLNFDELLQGLLQVNAAAAATAELLVWLKVHLRDLLQSGDFSALAKQAFIQERLTVFDPAAALFEQRLGALLSEYAVQADPADRPAVLELCGGVHPSVSASLADRCGFKLVRLALSRDLKQALSLQSAELTAPGVPAPETYTLEELERACAEQGLYFDVILSGTLNAQKLTHEEITRLASLSAQTLRAQGLVLLSCAGQSENDVLPDVLTLLGCGDADNVPKYIYQLRRQGLKPAWQRQLTGCSLQLLQADEAESADSALSPAGKLSLTGKAFILSSSAEGDEPSAQRLAECLTEHGAAVFGRGSAVYELFETRDSERSFKKALKEQGFDLHELCLICDLRAVNYAGSASQFSEILAAAAYKLKQDLLQASALGIKNLRVVTAGWALCAGRSAGKDWNTKRAADFALSQQERAQTAASALRALVRTAVNELKLDGVKLIACDLDADDQGGGAALGAELSARAPQYQEIALTGSSRYALMVRTEPAANQAAQRSLNELPLNRVLSFDKAGRLSSLCFKEQALPALKEHQILIEVKASALNFRDVLWAGGLLPDEALESGFAGASLGLECSGIVRAVGSKVSRFKAGDEVMAFGSACFGDYVVTSEGAALIKPQTFSFAEAAALPVVFFTAYYALCLKAQAVRSESVLIHGAAGGVGLAALQIAKQLGLTVYATAGSEVKRALVKALGADFVYNSRDLNFAAAIKEDTHGQGVDIVLNSLYDDGAALSLSLLKPLGRFIELGKRDFYADHPLFLKAFKDNLTYCGVDADELLNLKPELCERVMDVLSQAFILGTYKPIPLNLYPESAVVRAFSDLRSALGVGKYVVLKDSAANRGLKSPEQVNKAETTAGSAGTQKISRMEKGAAVISGGLGGLGQACAEALAQQGFKHLVLIGRKASEDSTVKAGLESLKQELTAQPETAEAQIYYLRCDLTEDQADQNLTAGLSELKLTAPVSLLIHAAGFLQDGSLKQLSLESFKALFNVKLKGALQLAAGCSAYNQSLGGHAGETELQSVFFSSIAALLGNPGQGNYAAANGALEGLACVLSARGQRAVSIGWGPVAEVGMLGGRAELTALLERRLGTAALSAAEVGAYLASCVKGAVCGERWYFKANWQQAAALVCAQQRFAFIKAQFAVSEAKASAEDLSQKLRALTGRELEEALLNLIKSEAAALLSVSQDSLNGTTELSSLGMDSLTLMELTVRLADALKLQLSAENFAACRSLGAFAKALARQFAGDSAEGQLLETMQEQHGVKLNASLAAAGSAVLKGGEESHG